MRILKKVPDMADQYVDKAKPLLSEKNHAVLLTGMTLVAEICRISPEAIREYRGVR